MKTSLASATGVSPWVSTEHLPKRQHFSPAPDQKFSAAFFTRPSGNNQSLVGIIYRKHTLLHDGSMAMTPRTTHTIAYDHNATRGHAASRSPPAGHGADASPGLHTLARKEARMTQFLSAEDAVRNAV